MSPCATLFGFGLPCPSYTVYSLGCFLAPENDFESFHVCTFIIVTFYLIFSRSVNFSLGDKKTVDDDEVEKRLRPSFLYSTYVSYLCRREGCHARKFFDFADFYYEIIIIADFSTFRLPFTRFCQNRYC